MNSSLKCGQRTIIPNFQLYLRTLQVDGGRQAEASPAVVKWVGECGFSSDYHTLIHKLKDVVTHAPDIDMVFIITAVAPSWSVPSSKFARKILSKPMLQLEDFIPRMGPFMTKGFNWLTITEITFSVFLHQPDSTFDFTTNSDTLSKYTGHRVHAQLTWFPNSNIIPPTDALP
jgi:hypothetical protein